MDVAPRQREAALVVEELEVEFRRGGVRAVRGLSLTLSGGRIVGVAGESGSGKSASALAIMGLLPSGTRVAGSIRYEGRELLGLPEQELRRVRGRDIAMIFQETGTALNPVLRVGDQMTMAVRAHSADDDVRERVLRGLADVRLPDPERVLRSYPHELSGGMCQRVMIAMALSCGSAVLIADEPTTALDVSVQAEILDLVRGLVKERHLAVMMISHDLAVLSELCDDLVVMYQGEVVETGPVGAVLRAPAHPYTRALLACLPRLHGERAVLPDLPPPDARPLPDGGCRYRDRCRWRAEVCEDHPALEPRPPFGEVRCWRAQEVLAGDAAEPR
jgi:peptide/nickel transport system ATP-binding protein